MCGCQSTRKASASLAALAELVVSDHLLMALLRLQAIYYLPKSIYIYPSISLPTFLPFLLFYFFFYYYYYHYYHYYHHYFCFLLLLLLLLPLLLVLMLLCTRPFQQALPASSVLHLKVHCDGRRNRNARAAGTQHQVQPPNLSQNESNRWCLSTAFLKGIHSKMFSRWCRVNVFLV